MPPRPRGHRGLSSLPHAASTITSAPSLLFPTQIARQMARSLGKGRRALLSEGRQGAMLPLFPGRTIPAGIQRFPCPSRGKVMPKGQFLSLRRGRQEA